MTDEPGSYHEMDDREVDLLLTAANQELLKQIHDAANAGLPLAAIMAVNALFSSIRDTQQMDAAGADLSDLEIRRVDALNGIIWNDQTTWPPGIVYQIRAQSVEIQPGVYQVRIMKTPHGSFVSAI